MVPYRDWLVYQTLALDLHCICFWHIYADGNYQPYLFPLPEHVWRKLVQ